MRAVVISSDSSVAARIEAVLQKRSWDCRSIPATASSEIKRIAGSSRPDVLIVVQSQSQESEELLKELKAQLKSKMVVLGPPDPRRILHLLHNCGVDEYLDEEDLEKEVEAMLRRSRGEATGKVIAVLSPSSGGGSSTIAANLASSIVAAGNQCCAIDLNLAIGDLAALLDVKPRHSIADLAKNLAEIDELLFSQTLTPTESGVALLSAPQRFEELPGITAKTVTTVVAMARTL